MIDKNKGQVRPLESPGKITLSEDFILLVYTIYGIAIGMDGDY